MSNSAPTQADAGQNEADAADLAELEPNTLPLEAWHIAHGARMVEFAGYQMPIQYEGIMAEHHWVRENAGLFDVSHMGQVTLSGDGLAEALEAIVPGDISALKAGRMRYSLLLAEDGGILDDLMITNTGHNLYLVVNGACKYDDLGHLHEHLPEDIVINHMDDYALLALQGPKAIDAMKALNIVPEEGKAPPLDEFYFMQAGPFLWGDIRLGVSRSGYTGEDGFEISVHASHAEKLADALVNLDLVKPIGLGARDSLRLEAGLPLYGHDLSPESTPVAGNLNFALSKRRREDGGFFGSERILGEYPDQSTMLRVGFVMDGRQPLREGAEIVDEAGAVIGAVTSGGFSPCLEKPIGMAIVPRALAAEGTALQARQRGKPFTVTVAATPFVQQRYYRKPKT